METGFNGELDYWRLFSPWAEREKFRQVRISRVCTIMTKHREIRQMPFTVRQMYDLVADIESYPEFIPWCQGAEIVSREPIEGGEVLESVLIISFKVLTEKLGSRVRLYPEQSLIRVEYLDGPPQSS